VHGAVAGMPPPLDFAKEKAVQKAVRECVRAGLLKAAHDCSDGGLAVALAEMCFGRHLGCRVSLKSQLAADALLFGEDASRIVVSYGSAAAQRIAAVCAASGAEIVEVGQVEGSSLVVEGLVQARVADLEEAWRSAVPKLVGEGVHRASLQGVP
jgi:phosphoribosylformylglycinamidine synthase